MRLPRVLIATVCLLTLSGMATADEPRVEDVAFKADCDGSEQRYVQIVPAKFDASAVHDVLIALHGHGSDRWQFAKDGRDECRAARDVAARHGMLYISPDYRAKTSWMGPKAEADVVQIVGDLKRRQRIGKVFVCGGSMGDIGPGVCGAASGAGERGRRDERDGESAGVSAVSGGDRGIVRRHEVQVPEQYKQRSAEYWPERLTMPIAVTTGGKDTLVPPESVLRLANVLKLMGREPLVIHRPEGGHSTNYEDGVAILERVIRAAK